MKPFSQFQYFWIVFLLLGTLQDVYAQREGEIDAAFNVSETIIDCKLQLTFTATGALNCIHQWDLGACGSNQVLTGTTVSFFVSNVNAYLQTPINVVHTINCNGTPVTFNQTYLITTQGIFIGKPGDYSAVLPASTLTGCNDGLPLLDNIVTNKNVYITSSLLMNKLSQTFDHSDICMDPGTSLLVGVGTAPLPNILKIINTSSVHNAGVGLQQSPIWKGISIRNNGRLSIENSTIKGALVGININENSLARVRLMNSTFENNYIGLAANSNFVNEGIAGNEFVRLSYMAPNFASITLDQYILNNVYNLEYNGTYRPFAGIFLANSILNISETNTFDALANGIFLQDCNSNILHCNFFNISKDGTAPYSDFTGYGIYIWNAGSPYSQTTRNIDDVNNFRICASAGIYLKNARGNTYFKSANFSSVGQRINGYRLELSSGLRSDPLSPINPSTIETGLIICKDYGVKATGNGFNSVNNFRIRTNEFFVGNTAAPTSTVKNYGVILNGVYAENNSVSVESNDFFSQDGVMSTGKVGYVTFQNIQNARVYNNSMSSGGLTLDGQISASYFVEGVFIDGGNNNWVDCNLMAASQSDPLFTAPESSQEEEPVSYWVKNSTYCTLMENGSSYNQNGIRFTGACTTGPISIKRNFLYRNNYDLVFDESAVTGPQYDGNVNNPKSNGNVWQGQLSGLYGARHKGNTFVVGNSQYFVPPTIVGTPTSQRPFYFLMDQNVPSDDWFKQTAVNNYETSTCLENAPSELGGIKINQTDRKIAAGSLFLGSDTPEGYYWLLQDYLYRKIADNSIGVDTIADVQSFMASKQSEPIGRFYVIKQGLKNLFTRSGNTQAVIDTLVRAVHFRIVDITRIDSVLSQGGIDSTARESFISLRGAKIAEYTYLSDSLYRVIMRSNQNIPSGIAALLAQNNAITTTKPWENNQKFVNQILLSNILSQVTVPIGDLNELQRIAELCPTYGGWAVYEARTMYAWLTGANVQEDPCVPSGERTNFDQQKQEESFIIFPNPASDHLFVRSDLADPQSILVLTNLLGQTVLEKILSKEQTEISISNIKPGTYFAQILGNGTKKTTGKVIIAH